MESRRFAPRALASNVLSFPPPQQITRTPSAVANNFPETASRLSLTGQDDFPEVTRKRVTAQRVCLSRLRRRNPDLCSFRTKSTKPIPCPADILAEDPDDHLYRFRKPAGRRAGGQPRGPPGRGVGGVRQGQRGRSLLRRAPLPHRLGARRRRGTSPRPNWPSPAPCCWRRASRWRATSSACCSSRRSGRRWRCSRGSPSSPCRRRMPCRTSCAASLRWRRMRSTRRCALPRGSGCNPPNPALCADILQLVDAVEKLQRREGAPQEEEVAQHVLLSAYARGLH